MKTRRDIVWVGVAALLLLFGVIDLDGGGPLLIVGLIVVGALLLGVGIKRSRQEGADKRVSGLLTKQVDECGGGVLGKFSLWHHYEWSSQRRQHRNRGVPCRQSLWTIQHAPTVARYRTRRGDGEWRLAFAFDPMRNAVLLVAGDKSGTSTRRFYRALIRKADERFDRHLARLANEGGS